MVGSTWPPLPQNPLEQVWGFHLYTLRVAEVAPHLDLPVRGSFRRPRKIQASPGPVSGGGSGARLGGEIHNLE